ncbi:caspase family protein [Flavobacterium sp. FlaQc-47]|uniref:caspase family protein n=1 Tax=Flavobacterium sp. FlaQc-47 TaxID=3374180 RepID=UPI003756C967
MTCPEDSISFFSMQPRLRKCAVIIGVNKTGSLPVLSAAVKGAEKVKEWADSQGIENCLITDKESAVTVKMIKKAISDFVNEKIYDQLIVYYSGHGILKSASDEQWLLSEAPEDINEAVNVQPSRLLSTRCGIPNVVIISDACRSLPNNPLVSEVFGSVIFPNIVPNNTDVNVDMLYATSPGNPAFEAAEDAAAKNYNGLYTIELLKGLNGEIPNILTDFATGLNKNHNGLDKNYKIVTAYELSEYLKDAVPIAAGKFDVSLSQRPKAEITSRTPCYLSLITNIGNTLVEETKDGNSTSLEEMKAGNVKIPDLIERYGQAIGPDRDFLDAMFDRPFKTEAGSKNSHETEPLEEPESPFEDYEKESVKPILQALDKTSKQIETGFTIVGIPYVNKSFEGDVNIFKENGAVQIRIYSHNRYKTFFLDLPAGGIIPLAILPGFIGTVVFDKGEILTVNYSRSFIGFQSLNGFTETNPEIEARRALIAVKSKDGIFKISENIEELSQSASYLRREKSLDPTLGLYAAYAYSQAGKFKDVLSIYEHMQREPQPVLFDVAMLNELSAKEPDPQIINAAAPFCPMLNQGWSYMSINPDHYDPLLMEVFKFRVPGLWTTFTPKGAALIRETFKDIHI